MEDKLDLSGVTYEQLLHQHFHPNKQIGNEWLINSPKEFWNDECHNTGINRVKVVGDRVTLVERSNRWVVGRFKLTDEVVGELFIKS